jgi:putative transposase
MVFLDAVHFKVRHEGQIVSKAAYIAIGVDLDGQKDNLAFGLGRMNPLSSGYRCLMNSETAE